MREGQTGVISVPVLYVLPAAFVSFNPVLISEACAWKHEMIAGACCPLTALDILRTPTLDSLDVFQVEMIAETCCQVFTLSTPHMAMPC